MHHPQSKPAVSFPLGQLVSTPGALRAMERAGVDGRELLRRHASGDWGDVKDPEQNDLALKHGERLLSVYQIEGSSEPIWIITEANRAVTTFLLPSEY